MIGRSRARFATRLWSCLPAAAAILLVSLSLTPGNATELAVKVENLSTPVLCAEEDNITLTLASPDVTSFRIEAVHPAYLAALREDNSDADWTACDFGPVVEQRKQAEATGGAAAASTAASPTQTPLKQPTKLPDRITLYEAVDKWLIGVRFPNFWREATATVRVGDKVTHDLSLIQLWRVRPNGGEEVLVLYPQDGYWRTRPVAPKGRDLTAFGSSFLIGPVEDAGRPIVRLKEIAYLPDLEGFDLTFAAGGSARVTLAEVSAIRTALDVTFSAGVAAKPFAALRSMYVSGYNNDVAAVAARNVDTKGWSEAAILDFKGATTPELWAGRHSISRHNTSSPDMIFKWFRPAPAAR